MNKGRRAPGGLSLVTERTMARGSGNCTACYLRSGG
jgi:hypothetical protein